MHPITMPLTPVRFTGVAGSLTLIAASYCLAHGLVIDDEINLPRTLAWAVTSTLPWVCAWEGMSRLSARPAQTVRLLLSSIILIAAFVTAAALEYALSGIYAVDTDSLAQIVYRLLPIPVGMAAARLLLIKGHSTLPAEPVRLKPDPHTPRPDSHALPWVRLQPDNLLDVPTRGGTLAVPACDIEYVKAAGNYVELITRDRTLLMRTTLHDLGEQLRDAGFVRVHRSLLVNAVHVRSTRRGPRGRRVVKLRSGAELPVGRQFEAAFVTFAHRSPQED